MNNTLPANTAVASPQWIWPDAFVAAFLFIATAAIVVWQNSRLGVLWDLSYILENSYRIAIGEFPYRDFPFPYPPLTFLIQAAIIRFSGRVFWHHIVYCAVMGGLATVMTWRILLNLLGGELRRPRLPAFILSLPVVILGIYSVYPHPFYDPDATLAILGSVLLLLGLERQPLSRWRCVLAGASLVIPLFVKQNAGLAFLASAGAAILILLVIQARRRQPIGKYLWLLIAAGLTLGCASLIVHFTVGLREYWYWTIQFAAARRTPAGGEMLAIYADRNVAISTALVVVGLVTLWLARRGNRKLTLLSAALISVPFAWPAVYLLRDVDPSERAERLLTLWPVVLIFALIVAILNARRRQGLSRVLPFVLIATVNGVFMSQQLWGSTYAIWPLFMILLASTLSGVTRLRFGPEGLSESPLRYQDSWLFVISGAAVLSLLLAGAAYVWSHERLDYANLDEGALTRSSLPRLKGLATRGDWLPNFEELVGYVEREIPANDGILLIPGEDLFYYTTGRRPHFPVLMFDHTVNPYSPEEIRELAAARDIRWVIVKQNLQDEDEAVEKQRDELTEALSDEFEQIESLTNYDIYRRVDSSEVDPQ